MQETSLIHREKINQIFLSVIKFLPLKCSPQTCEQCKAARIPTDGNKDGGCHFASCCTHEWFFFLQYKNSAYLSNFTKPTPTIPQQKSLVLGFYLGLFRGVEENKWFSCDTEISRQDPHTEGKIRDISVPFLTAITWNISKHSGSQKGTFFHKVS